MNLDFFGSLLTGQTLIQPGTSGSPLIRKENGALFQINLPEGDSLDFLLNQKGFLCLDDYYCPNEYRAIIEVISNQGNDYLIDLRDLFFY